MRDDDRRGASEPRRDVFRLPGFPAFWAAEAVSEAGSYVTTVALQVLVVVTLSGSAFEVGLVSAARWLPYAVLGILAGALLERRRRKPLLIGTDLGRAALLLAIPALWAVDLLGLPALLAVVAAFGALSLVNDTATQSFLPRLVPRRDLLAANARLDQSSAVAQVAGPVAGGGLVTLLGAPLAVLLDALSFVASAILTATVRVAEPLAPPARRSLATLRREIAEGLRFTYRHRELGPLAIGTHAWFLANSVLVTAFAPFALATLGLDAALLGVVLAAAGVGALVGASLSTRLGRRFGVGPVVIGGHVLMAAGWAIVGSTAWLGAGDGPEPGAGPGAGAIAALVAGQALVGFAMGAQNANEMGFRQAVAPDALQGRMNATLRSTNRGIIVVGAPLGGLFADAAGAGTAFATGIAGILLVAAFLALSPARDARHPDA
jgi:MFS family permease